jgi:hypothetical protein
MCPPEAQKVRWIKFDIGPKAYHKDVFRDPELSTQPIHQHLPVNLPPHWPDQDSFFEA